ncbi:MAG TPA: sodium-dependent transporter [Phycisphaerae bacterium]|nr:sodium-dependent transporter [Phycisphaerae bacterium]
MAKNSRALEPALARGRTTENWGSRLGVILAVAGSAVGLGNFLRFPGLAATYGGGVFMIPYFTALLLLGIPICWVEWSMGRYGGSKGYHSAPGIFTVLWRTSYSKYFGALALLVPLVIYMYYVYIEAWCLAYAFSYARGAMNQIAESNTGDEQIAAFRDNFRNFVGMGRNGFPGKEGLIFLAIVISINFYLIFRGLTKGIEAFCKFAMPMLILFALIILARVLTLGTPDPSKPEANINNALGFMWNPKPDSHGHVWGGLADPELWLAAAGQVFFTLSVGFGIVLNYASYLRKDDDVVLSGLTASATNEFCEVCLGGLITIPVAFLFLGSANLTKEVLGSPMTLGFQALPAVFCRMPAGQWFGAIWFFMLFLAAITSSLSMLQPAIAFLEEGLNLGRRASVTCLGFICLIGNLIVVFFSKNLLALDTMDFWVGTVCIYILATIQVITVAWVFGVPKARKEVARGADLRIPGIFWFIIKYVSPLYLLIIFAAWCYKSIPGKIREIAALPDTDRHVVQFVLLFILAVLLFFTMLIYLAGRRFRPDGLGEPAEQEVAR